jgi:DnaJ-like protein
VPGFEDSWSALGVSPEADESEIKKAYARLLKAVRPDEDAEAFQELVEARNAALAYARRLNARRSKRPPLEEPERLQASVEVFEPNAQIADAPRPRIAREEPAAVETPLASPAVEDSQANAADLLNVILSGLKLDAKAPELEGAKEAIGGLAILSASARKLAEPELLQALAPLLPVISDRLMRGRSRGFFQRLFSQERKDPEGAQRAAAQLDLARRLNEEFGWTQSDRRVHALIGRDAATPVMLYLNAFQRLFDATNTDDPEGIRPMPSIDERDARAYFGDTYGTYAPLLAKVHSGSRWPVRWRTQMFLVLPAWLVGARHFPALFVWIIAFCTALFMVKVSHASPYGGTPYAPLIFIVGCLPLLALHVWAGAYAYRLDIDRFLAKTKSADRRGIFDPNERSSFLAKSSNYARRLRLRPKWRMPWWFILLAVSSLLRIIAALTQHGS